LTLDLGRRYAAGSRDVERGSRGRMMSSTDETASAPASAVPLGHRFAGRYEVVEALGTGGMGSVYRARDLELGEDVAVKVTRPEIAGDPESIRRFGRELKLARRISHRHVVRVYELMEDHGTRFIVMEYVPGEDLRSLIRRSGHLGVPRALGIAGQVCEGLAAAHRLGVVHRDLKPANVMLDAEGNARIMDFGLARSVLAGESTVHGVVVGTPGYMAPEQAAGLESDHRADIYALGAMLFAMLTGEKPLGPAWHALFARVRGEAGGGAAVPVSEIPAPLLSVLATCLEADPARRFQSVEELQARLAALAGQEGPQETAATASAGAPGAAPAEVRGNSIAVLPFADLSPERDQEYFCDGIADELTSSLTAIKDLRIAARGSSFSFKGKAVDIREIGRRLNVATVLDGSVRKAGNRLRITAQLISVTDGYQLWSERYDRDLADIFAIQDEVTGAIIEHLKLSLLPHEQQAVFKRPTEDVEAHSHYLRGLHYLLGADDPPLGTPSGGFGEAIVCFEQAVARDPGYALAHLGLAAAYVHVAFWGTTAPSSACERAKQHARKALEIDPALGEAHGVLSCVYTIHDWNWPAAEREAREAVRLSPRSHYVRVYYSVLLSITERFEQALAEATEALRLDPDNSHCVFAKGLALMCTGRHQQAIDTLRAGIAAHPGFYILSSFLGDAHGLKGEYDQALTASERAVELSGRAPFIVGRFGVECQRCGQAARAETILHELERRAGDEHVPPTSLFLMNLVRGNLASALRWLEKAGETHDSYLGWIRIWPWQGLRAPREPRLKAMAKKAFVRLLVGRIIRRHRILQG
jgi:eukaryotic-like serine/threonine-protein kinase